LNFRFLARQLATGQERQGVLYSDKQPVGTVSIRLRIIGHGLTCGTPQWVALVWQAVGRMLGVAAGQFDHQLSLPFGRQPARIQPLVTVRFGQSKQLPLAQPLEKPSILRVANGKLAGSDPRQGHHQENEALY
jgi:hypothetical protein